MRSRFLPVRFFARGDCPTFYYLKQVDSTSTLWWLAEQVDHEWVNVFRGRLSPGNAADDRWEGDFVDVPKGLTCGHGHLDLQLGFRDGERVISRTSFGSGYCDSALVEGHTSAFDGRPVTARDPGFIGAGLDNLTGVWQGNDGGTYYIREVSGTGQIAWAGEHPAAEPSGGDTMPGRQWVNVFMGQRRHDSAIGDSISGEWTDTPKGEVNNDGCLTLAVVGANLLRVVEMTGGFGGTEFRRRVVREEDPEALLLTLTWDTLEIRDSQEWFFEADEPYFMALIAKMDGRSVDFSALPSASVDLSNSFFTPMLGDNVGAPTVIPLAGLVPPVTTSISPIRHATLDQMRTVFGVAVRGWEHDTSSQDWITEQLEDWKRTAGNELKRELRATGSVNFRRDIARWHESHSLLDEDDAQAFPDAKVFSFNNLLSLVGAPPRGLVFELRGGDSHYRLRATLAVARPRANCEP
jgi:hypothetical protein